jgi:hypothetical protein
MRPILHRLWRLLNPAASVRSRLDPIAQGRRFRPRIEELEGRLAPAGLVWQTPWQVWLESGSGDGGYGWAGFGDTGAAGDEGPATAAASAFAYSSGNPATPDDGPSYATFTGSVSFRRTFELVGSPTGWNVSLDGLLYGSLYAQGSSSVYGWATVNARVQVIQGTTGSVTHDLDFGQHEAFSGEGSQQLTVSVPGTRDGVIPDGTYTVSGSLVASATGHGDPWGPTVGIEGSQAYSAFDFDPPGLVTTIDAVPSDSDNRPAVSVGDATFVEGNTGAATRYFTVALAHASDRTVTVDFTLTDGSATLADNDYGYLDSNRTVTFGPGVTEQRIAVAIHGDRRFELNESFSLNLSNAMNATIADGQGVGTITDDEPRISIGDVSRSEGSTGQTPFTFTVTLSAAYDVPVTVEWVTADGSATAGSDYLAAGGTLTFAPGVTTQPVSVAVLGDAVFEPGETFTVNLSNASGAVITRAAGLATIVNDDNNLPRISIGDVSRVEGRNGNTFFTFTVTLSAPSAVQVKVNYATADGTARTADADYETAAGTLTFAPGETSKTITIKVKGDPKREEDETFFVNLFGPSQALLLDPQGLGTILNDD